jgi:hypothetical protein
MNIYRADGADIMANAIRPESILFMQQTQTVSSALPITLPPVLFAKAKNLRMK